MGKLSNFQIVIKDGKDVFRSGEIVEGNILVDLTEEMEMNGKLKNEYSLSIC